METLVLILSTFYSIVIGVAFLGFLFVACAWEVEKLYYYLNKWEGVKDELKRKREAKRNENDKKE